MPKATKAIDAPRRHRKPTFTLNLSARRLVQVHRKVEAAEQAFRAAAEAERLGGRDVEKLDFSPSTLRLRDKWHALMWRLAADCDAIADRIASKRKPSPADCLTLAVASWHSKRADTQCSLALLRFAGIDLSESNVRCR